MVLLMILGPCLPKVFFCTGQEKIKPKVAQSGPFFSALWIATSNIPANILAFFLKDVGSFSPINTSKMASKQLEEARFCLPFCCKWNHNLQKYLGGEQRSQHAASPPHMLRGYTSWWIKTRARRAMGALFPGIINESRGVFFLSSWQPNNAATRSQIITPKRDF